MLLLGLVAHVMVVHLSWVCCLAFVDVLRKYNRLILLILLKVLRKSGKDIAVVSNRIDDERDWQVLILSKYLDFG